MKSRGEFNTDEEYRDYLTIYFSGIAMGGILSLPHADGQAPEEFTPEHVAALSCETAEALVKEVGSHI